MKQDAASQAEKLVQVVRDFGTVAVAFSGGVDSSVVAAAAYRALADRSLAITAISPSVASWQREIAESVAREIGIRHRWIQTDEMESIQYRRNDAQRCFHCKKTLYRSAMNSIAEKTTGSVLLSGTNADDLGDYRPGLKAGKLAGVRTPLADLGMTKSDVRAVAKHFGLTNDKLPASPCLSSRIAYGVEVTPARLRRIDQCESWLRTRGFDDVRVRLYVDRNDDRADELARIEVPLNDLPRLRRIEPEFNGLFCFLGFDRVTIDPAGLRSGNLNAALVPLSVSATDLAKQGGIAR